jgi:hypothetical protein
MVPGTAGVIPTLAKLQNTQALADINGKLEDKFAARQNCAPAMEMNMLPSSFSCPRCKCGACHRLHRKGIDRLISMFGFRPLGCLTCGKKFYARYSDVKAHLQNTTEQAYPGKATYSGNGVEQGSLNG